METICARLQSPDRRRSHRAAKDGRTLPRLRRLARSTLVPARRNAGAAPGLGVHALFIGCSEAIGVWLKKSDPDLLAARMKSPISADQKFSDRAVMSAILVVFVGWFGFMAVDARRCGWSHTPLWARAGRRVDRGRLLWLGRGAKGEQFRRSHGAAAQEERGQTVISTGPYAVVRHPMYAYAVLS
jgi:protein-S-isoprenylcysteine O-methyltransferase Ste14